jgi:hypothetical protein
MKLESPSKNVPSAPPGLHRCLTVKAQPARESAAVYGSIIAQIVFVLVPSLWYVRRLLRRLTPSHAEAELVS